jgi:hypothetical protein
LVALSRLFEHRVVESGKSFSGSIAYRLRKTEETTMMRLRSKETMKRGCIDSEKKSDYSCYVGFIVSQLAAGAAPAGEGRY